MARYIVKLTDPRDGRDYYLEWSTVVDAPTTYGMSLPEFREFYRDEYGRSGAEDLDQRLERVREKGVSAHHYHSVADLIAGNHAGENHEELDLEGLLDRFCRRVPP